MRLAAEAEDAAEALDKEAARLAIMASMDPQEQLRLYKEHVESLDDEADPRGKAGRFYALTRAAEEIDLTLSPPLHGAQTIEGWPPLSLPLPPRGTVSRTAVKSTKAAAPAKKKSSAAKPAAKPTPVSAAEPAPPAAKPAAAPKPAAEPAAPPVFLPSWGHGINKKTMKSELANRLVPQGPHSSRSKIVETTVLSPVFRVFSLFRLGVCLLMSVCSPPRRTSFWTLQ